MMIPASLVRVGDKIAGGPLGALHHATWCGISVIARLVPTIRVAALEVLCQLLLEDVLSLIDMRHPRLVPLLGVLMDPPALIQPLYDHATTASPETIPSGGLMRVLRDIASALAHMHSRRPAVAHGALRPSCILIDSFGSAHVTDYGLRRARAAGGVDLRGTRWLAPEVAKGGRLTIASDVWTFGLIVCILLTTS